MEFAQSNHVPEKVLINEEGSKNIPDLGVVLEKISKWEIKLRVSKNQLTIAENVIVELEEKYPDMPRRDEIEESDDCYDDYLYYYFMLCVRNTLRNKIMMAKLELRWHRDIKKKICQNIMEV